MNVDQFLILLGGIIIAGFIGNLVFRYLKIPSVLLLIALGLLLGPVLHIVPTAPLLDIAPYFGTLALLIILFEGGLDLEIHKVLEEAGATLLLTIATFLISYLLVFGFAFFILKLPLVAALILAGMLGGTSPAIILPVVSQLRISKNLQTMLSIEPALADALIIVSVLLTLQIHQSPTTSFWDIAQSVIGSFLIAIVIAVLAGVVWARFISTLRGEAVSYMLTLGFLFLLYVAFEHSGGNGAVGILFFGTILANVGPIVQQVSGKIRRFLGVKIDATKYALDQFVHNITVEISFLVRTFFFVFLGLLIDFQRFTPEAIAIIFGLTLLLLLGRFLGAQLLFKLRPHFSVREKWLTVAMVPRGLATAVMAFLPISLGIPGTESFVLYALGTIVLTSFIMSGLVAYVEFKFPPEVEEAPGTAGVTPPAQTAATAPVHSAVTNDTGAPSSTAAPQTTEKVPPAVSEESSSIFPQLEKESATHHPTLAELLMQWFGISWFRFKELDFIAIQSLRFRDTLFWFQTLATTFTVTLGVMLDLPIIVTIGLFFSPIAPLMNTISFSLTTGDVYLFLKALTKFLATTALVFFLSLLISLVLPFIGIPELLHHIMNPTLLDFVLAVAAGIFLSLVILRGRSTELLLIAPLIAYLIFLPIVTLGFSLGSAGEMPQLLRAITGSFLLFTTNLTGLLLGSVIILLLLRVTHHVASEYIEEWKQEELGSRWLRKLFAESRIARWLGATGTVRARIFVLLVFALILMIPLQRTVDEITLRYKVSQILKNAATEFFEQPNRSSVLAVEYDVREHQVIARIRIATSQFFTQKEIHSFEREVETRLGMPVELHLIQSPGSIGAAPESLPTTEHQFETFPERLNYLLSDLEAAIAAIPATSGIRILHIGPRFVPATRQTLIEVSYLRHRELSEETASLVKSLIAQSLQIPIYNVILQWIPDYYTSTTPQLSHFQNPVRQIRLIDVLLLHPSVHLTIYLPSKVEDLEEIKQRLAQQLANYLTPDQWTLLVGSTQQYEAMLSVPEATFNAQAASQDEVRRDTTQ